MKNNQIRLVGLLTIFLLWMTTVLSGESSPYVSPVDHQIKLTGNFMEIRGNHFHAGIDIKSSTGKAGDAVYSVSNGFISRIKIQSGGYGNVLYIDHPNGYTSVYAHLDNFIPEIEELVKKIQYEVESFEIDVFLPDSSIVVGQKDMIGRMGNSGRSFGPHLHFELRETVSERPVNPELYGLGPTDGSPPVLESLHIYNLNNQQSVVDTDIRYFNSKKKGYQLYSDEIEVNSSSIGLGIQMFDRMDGSTNKNGIYSYKLYVDDSLHFAWKADIFDFEQDVLMKGFIDFRKNISLAQKIYLLYRQVCNDFNFYAAEVHNGIIHLPIGKIKKVSIEIADLHENTSKVNFNLVNSEEEKKEENNLRTQPCDSSYFFSGNYFEVLIPENTLFSPTQIEIEESLETIGGQKSPFVSIADRYTAVKNYYTINITNPNIKDFRKLVLASFDNKGRMIHYGMEQIGDNYFAQVAQCGEFFLFRDKIKPTIEILNFDKTRSKPWTFRIKDNLIPSGKIDDLYYRASVEGKWVRLKYDKKDDLLIFEDFDSLPDGPFTFHIQVSDYCGNKAEKLRVIN